jgi:hypothetical protein
MSMQKRDIIFASFMALGILLFGPYMYYSFKMYVKGMANKPYPEYDWPEMSELWKTCVAATI